MAVPGLVYICAFSRCIGVYTVYIRFLAMHQMPLDILHQEPSVITQVSEAIVRHVLVLLLEEIPWNSLEGYFATIT